MTPTDDDYQGGICGLMRERDELRAKLEAAERRAQAENGERDALRARVQAFLDIYSAKTPLSERVAKLEVAIKSATAALATKEKWDG
jgi:hypothetical protein